MLVTTATWQRSNARPSRNIPPRAVSSTAASTSGCASTLRALRGPLQSPLSVCLPLTYTPSVLVMPTRSPCVRSKWEVRRTVVVFPLVPVTAMTGTRPSSPFGNMVAMTASPTSRPLPKDGLKCIRKPGAALTSTTPPLCSSSGCKTDSQTTSTPQISKPTIWAAAMARAATSGCTSSVTSVAVPPVERLALLRKITRVPLEGMEFSSMPCSLSRFFAMSSRRIFVREVAWPSPRRGSALTCSTNSRTVFLPLPITKGGSRLAAATNLLPTTSNRKSLPGR